MNTVCGSSGIEKMKFQHESHFVDLAFERLFESTVGKLSAECNPQTMATNTIPRETLQDDQNNHESLNKSSNDFMENCVVNVAPVYECDLTLSSRRDRQVDGINCVLPTCDVLQNNGENYSPSIQQKVSTDMEIRYSHLGSSSKCSMTYSKDFVSVSTSVNSSSVAFILDENKDGKRKIYSSENEISSSNYSIQEGHNLSINKIRNSLVTNQMPINCDLRPSVRRSHSVRELRVQEPNVARNIARSNTLPVCHMARSKNMPTESDLQPSVRRSHSVGELEVQKHNVSSNIACSNTLPVCHMARSKNMPSKSDLQPSVRRSHSVRQEHNDVNNIAHSSTLPVFNMARNRNTHGISDLQPSVRRRHSVEGRSRQERNVVNDISRCNTPPACNMTGNRNMRTDTDLQPSVRSRRTSLPSPYQQNACFRNKIAQEFQRESLESIRSLNGQKAYESHETSGHISTLEICYHTQFKESSVTVQPTVDVNKPRITSEKTNAVHVQSIKSSAVNSLELKVIKDIESKSVYCDSGTSFDLNLANSENSNLSCQRPQHNKKVSPFRTSRQIPLVHRSISLPLDEIETCHENDGDNYLTSLTRQDANSANQLTNNKLESYHKSESHCKVGKKRRRFNSGIDTSVSVNGISAVNCKRLKKRSSYSDIFVRGNSLTPKSDSSKRLLPNSSDSSLKSSLDEPKQNCSKNRLREGIQAIPESDDMVRGVTKPRRSKKPLCSYKNEQNKINRIHETIASADQSPQFSTTLQNENNESDTAGVLNLENVIPLGAALPPMKNIRKAKLESKPRKGALDRTPSKEGIWININSKY